MTAKPKVSRVEATKRVKEFLQELADHGWYLHVQYSTAEFFISCAKKEDEQCSP